jgi:hypothetical protein
LNSAREKKAGSKPYRLEWIGCGQIPVLQKGKPIDGFRHFGADGLGWPCSRVSTLSRKNAARNCQKLTRMEKPIE